jgi:hypothetical protein
MWLPETRQSSADLRRAYDRSPQAPVASRGLPNFRTGHNRSISGSRVSRRASEHSRNQPRGKRSGLARVKGVPRVPLPFPKAQPLAGACSSSGARIGCHALRLPDDPRAFTPPPNHWQFDDLTRTNATGPVDTADSYSRASARQCSPNHNPSPAGRRFRKKGPPLLVASVLGPRRAAPGQAVPHTRRRTAARHAARASRIHRVPAAQERIGKNRGRDHAAFGFSVAGGSGGQSFESGLPSSHPRKAATAVAVNRSRPLSALANVCLDKPSAAANRDCVPRFRARILRSSNRSCCCGVGIGGSTSAKRPAGCSSMAFVEARAVATAFDTVGAGCKGAR